jgi:hypothetical protein
LRVTDLSDAYQLVRVTATRDLPAEQTYSIETDCQTFVADGCVVHNTNFPPKRSAQQINQTFGKQLTAANFDIVEKVYRSMVRRIKSRFQTAGGDFPGMVIMVSSAATLDSFTERKIREARQDPTVFVRDHTAWTSKPMDHFCGKWFYVLCSKSSLRSRILEDGEYDEISPEYLEENNAWLIEVPVEYKEDFESNLEDSLRDIAGVSTQAISAFFQRVDAIEACIVPGRKHPFSSEVWVSGSPATFDWDYLCRRIERRLPGGFTETAWAPKESPSSPRWIHIDTSISGDSTGFCCGRIDRWVEVVRRDGEGHAYTDTAPYYVIEVLLSIRPPSGDQIYMPDLRRLVYELQAHGFPIHGFSSDSFQYVEMHQQIRRHGIHTELISMDRTIDPYEELKSAIYEKRIEFYEYTNLLQELRSLEYDRVKGKIDHPRHSSKDCISGDTRISLLNGSEVMIRDLVGQEFWVYACTPNGTVVPAHAHNVHLVGDRDVMRIWLDNGSHLDCTPDHEIMMRDGEFREAKSISVGDSLMPLYRDVSVANPKHGLDGYERVLDNKTGRYVFTHQLVANTVGGFAYAGNRKERRIIHHADFNKRNNDPANLVPMEWHEHLRVHRTVASQNMKRLWEDDEYRKKACLRSGKIGRVTGPINMTRYNRSQERIEKLQAKGTFAANGKKVMQQLWADPEYRRRHRQRVSGSGNHWARKDVTMDRILTVAASVTSQVDLLRELRCTQKVLARVLLENGMSCRDLAVKFGHHRHRGSAAYQFRHDVTFDRVLETAKTVSTVQELCATMKCTPKVYHRVIQSQGWTAAKFKGAHFKKSQTNHQVVRVEMLGAVPVYDMTVDVHHNFAISAGMFVHNCSDALAGTIWGLRQQAARLPWAADADTPRVAVGHDHGWVSDMIPAEDVDLDEVRAARSAQSAHVLMPFFIGDD